MVVTAYIAADVGHRPRVQADTANLVEKRSGLRAMAPSEACSLLGLGVSQKADC